MLISNKEMYFKILADGLKSVSDDTRVYFLSSSSLV